MQNISAMEEFIVELRKFTTFREVYGTPMSEYPEANHYINVAVRSDSDEDYRNAIDFMMRAMGV